MEPEGTHFGFEPGGEAEPSKSGGESEVNLLQKCTNVTMKDKTESYSGNQSLLKEQARLCAVV